MLRTQMSVRDLRMHLGYVPVSHKKGAHRCGSGLRVEMTLVGNCPEPCAPVLLPTAANRHPRGRKSGL